MRRGNVMAFPRCRRLRAIRDVPSTCGQKQASQPNPWRTLSPALELQAKGELQIALALAGGAAAFGEYFTEGRWILRVEADIGRTAATTVAAPIRMVPDVVGFGAELEAKALVHGDSLEQSHVPIFVPGLGDEVADALCVESP